MLQTIFDPTILHRAVIYSRMSSDRQNPRSPDQQANEIRRVMEGRGYHWDIVQVYRDDAISGKYVRKRPGLQQMLQDLRSGRVVASLILVDTLERFGRAEEIQRIRQDLREKSGVLILTADSQFADPTTTQGQILGLAENFRATEDGRIKAHNVLRGKRDAVQQGQWPGGRAPFGYRLENVMKTIKGREEVDYCRLAPDPTTRGVIEHLFELADQTLHGCTRLARALNEDSRIHVSLKPFQPATVAYWLDSPIYYGVLEWGKNSTGIVSDTRIVRANSLDKVICFPGFCEPLVSKEQWDRVQAIRRLRREHSLAARHRNKSAWRRCVSFPSAR